MKFLVVVLALLCGCPQKRLEQPKPATPLAMIEASTDLDGKLVGNTRARATIVVLMASWCGHCRTQLVQLAAIQQAHPKLRVLGVNYKAHEEYDNRGNAAQLRAYVENVPWLRVVPAGEPLFDALGRPPFVPAVWVYNANGELVQFFDRREREPPTVDELETLLARLGA